MVTIIASSWRVGESSLSLVRLTGLRRRFYSPLTLSKGVDLLSPLASVRLRGMDLLEDRWQKLILFEEECRDIIPDEASVMEEI